MSPGDARVLQNTNRPSENADCGFSDGLSYLFTGKQALGHDKRVRRLGDTPYLMTEIAPPSARG
ncbi:hypothetical protein [Kingella potus]|uniref:hypothetical protein n=1 Tax=Kingella potus TaxID=265175 RepID=UPI001FD1C3DF|nr:hypothetical protein [Kingella potus]UOP01763.1 hypothetical protein LVJ84_06540 [Kingella potus]